MLSQIPAEHLEQLRNLFGNIFGQDKLEVIFKAMSFEELQEMRKLINDSAGAKYAAINFYQNLCLTTDTQGSESPTEYHLKPKS